ncbi:MAG TPA: hypothetical protein VFQ65_25210 [Kofleriaceae bacterium]|nr:hypothetical protein [Kofleriaceae bacterium]
MRLAWIALALLVPARAFADEPAPAPPEPPAAPAEARTAAPPPAPPPAAPVADPDSAADYRPQPMKKDIVIKVYEDRDTNNVLMLGGIAGLGAVLGAVGVYYNLDSRDAAKAVSPKMPTNQPWTATQQADYDRAHSSGVKAGIFYGLGGAALLASAVLFIVTAPSEQATVIHPHYAIAPTQGGAFVARAWSF